MQVIVPLNLDSVLFVNIQVFAEIQVFRNTADKSPVYTTENFWHGSGEIGTGSKKKRFGSDKICSVNNLSVPNFIRAEPKFLPVLGPSAW